MGHGKALTTRWPTPLPLVARIVLTDEHPQLEIRIQSGHRITLKAAQPIVEEKRAARAHPAEPPESHAVDHVQVFVVGRKKLFIELPYLLKKPLVKQEAAKVHGLALTILKRRGQKRIRVTHRRRAPENLLRGRLGNCK